MGINDNVREQGWEQKCFRRRRKVDETGLRSHCPADCSSWWVRRLGRLGRRKSNNSYVFFQSDVVIKLIISRRHCMDVRGTCEIFGVSAAALHGARFTIYLTVILRLS